MEYNSEIQGKPEIIYESISFFKENMVLQDAPPRKARSGQNMKEPLNAERTTAILL